MRNKKINSEYLNSVRLDWTAPCFEAVPEGKRETYKNRVKAVDMYIDGRSCVEIEKTTSISRGHVLRFVQYCLTENEKGELIGYEALIPYTRKVQVARSENSSSTSGLFAKLLSDYPELKEYIIGNFTGDKKYTLEKNMSFSSLWLKFLQKCRDLGLGEDDYPFNTVSMAEMSLRRYLKNISDKNMKISACRIDDDSKQIQNGTGYKEKYNKTAVIPYSNVQIDGHVIDIIYTSEVEMDDGTIENLECTRCWLIAVIDVATRCIIGYSLSQQFNYNQYDVLRAIQNSLQPHKKLELKIEGLSMPEAGGFPSDVYKETQYALFDAIMLDNAKAHLAVNVVDKICNDLKSTVNFGAVSTPETRGIVERFFGTLENKGFHRLPSTTGSNPRDVKRSNPEIKARKYKITFDEISQLTEILIAEYNNSPHSTLFNRTPLEEMGIKLKCGMLPCIATDKERTAIKELTYSTRELTVRGNKEKGRRPYIIFMSVKYRNDILSSDYSYIGQNITVRYNPDDISVLNGYLKGGKFLGILKASGEYGRKPHSIKSRKEISKFAREQKKANTIFSTPVTDYENYLNEKAKDSKRARTKAEILRKELGKPEISAQEKTTAEVIDFRRPQKVTKPELTFESIMDLSSEDLWKKIKEVSK